MKQLNILSLKTRVNKRKPRFDVPYQGGEGSLAGQSPNAQGGLYYYNISSLRYQEKTNMEDITMTKNNIAVFAKIRAAKEEQEKAAAVIRLIRTAITLTEGLTPSQSADCIHWIAGMMGKGGRR